MIMRLAYNNIKKSYRVYLVYIFTLTLTISLFYGFNALESSHAIQTLAKEDANYTSVFLTLMNMTSYFVSFFVVFLMVYASDFFFKVRSNEYYIYKTLGMSKKELIKLVFLENIIIGLISLLIGIILGVFFNQILSTTLVNYIELDSSFKLEISLKAIIKTASYFIGLLAVISAISATRINKKSIIELKNIKSIIIKKQMTKTRSISLILFGMITLVVSYFMGYVSELNPGSGAFYISILCGFIGTIAMYFGIINYKNTNFKCKTPNEKTLKNSILFNRLMKNKMSISMISVSFVFILTSIFGASALIGLLEFGDFLPTDAQIVSYVPDEYNLEQIDLKEYDLENQGAIYNELLYVKDDYFIPIVKQTEFNNVIKILENENNISTNEYDFFAGEDQKTFDENGNIANKEVNNKDGLKNINVPNNSKINISENKKVEKIFPRGVLVVKDSKLLSLLKNNIQEIDSNYVNQYLLINYKTKNDEKKVVEINKDINQGIVVLTTKQQLFKTSLVFKVSILFVTLYVAFFLVIISLAILAIQQIMDAIDNKEEYRKLKILGLNKNDLRKIINKNTNIYFIYPLILAVFSSIFALLSVDHFIKLVSGDHLLNQNSNQNTIYILIILGIIYIVYIKLVKSVYYKIVGV